MENEQEDGRVGGKKRKRERESVINYLRNASLYGVGWTCGIIISLILHTWGNLFSLLIKKRDSMLCAQVILASCKLNSHYFFS